MDGMQWFILRVRSRSERRVIEKLKERGVTAAFVGYRPFKKQGEDLKDCTVDIPGVVFIQMKVISGAIHWHLLEGIKDAYRMIGWMNGLRSARVSSRWLDGRLKDVALVDGSGTEKVIFLKRQEQEAIKALPSFKAGDLLRIVRGPWTGVEAPCEELVDDGYRLRIGDYPVTVAEEYLQLAS